MEVKQALANLKESKVKLDKEYTQIKKNKGANKKLNLRLKKEEIDSVQKRIDYLFLTKTFVVNQYVTNLKRNKVGQIKLVENEGSDRVRFWVDWEESLILISERADLLKPVEIACIKPKWDRGNFIRPFDHKPVTWLSSLFDLKSNLSDTNQIAWVVYQFNSLVQKKIKVGDVISYQSRTDYFKVTKLVRDQKQGKLLSLQAHVYDYKKKKVFIAAKELWKVRVLNPSEIEKIEEEF